MESAAYSNFFTPQQTKNEQKQKILNGLNDSQKQVVENYKGYSIVSAGPGSGNVCKSI